MAGIGFELKKLFVQKGILANIRAYGYAGIVCTGPMLLGILLLFGVRSIASLGGASAAEKDTLVAMITYTLIASLTVSNLLAMVVTRYTADMLYVGKPERILPSFYGSSAILLTIGGIGYGVFLYLSESLLIYKILNLILFCLLVVVWLQVSYITALKDYRKILLWFVAGVAVAITAGLLFLFTDLDIICALLLALILGYGTIMTGFFILMHRYFSKGQGSSFHFLEWIDRFPSLLWMGIFASVGVFSHLVITWFGPNGRHVLGLLYDAPQYDVPAFIAFLSVLPTTIGFVTSIEVNFYPKYKQYFSLYQNGGPFKDIEQAELDMIQVLKREMYYLAQRQFITTLLFVIIGGSLIPPSSLGMNESSLSVYRILCIGYGLYAIANSMFLILLYFSDNKGALLTSFSFMAGSTLGTIFFALISNNLLGFGFFTGGLIMYVVAWAHMRSYLNALQYHVLGAQPILAKEPRGIFTLLSRSSQKHSDLYEKRPAKRVQKLSSSARRSAWSR